MGSKEFLFSKNFGLRWIWITENFNSKKCRLKIILCQTKFWRKWAWVEGIHQRSCRKTRLQLLICTWLFQVKMLGPKYIEQNSLNQRWARLWSRDWDWDQGGLKAGLKLWDHLPKVSVSVSNFETTMQKSQSQSQNAMDGLAHHRFWNP